MKSLPIFTIMPLPTCATCKINVLFIAICLSFICTTSSFAQERTCNSIESHERNLENPEYQRAFQLKMESVTQQQNRFGSALCPAPVILPMAVHYSGLGTLSQSDMDCLVSLAENQVQILNDDYQALNSDISNWSGTGGSSSIYPGVSNGETCIEFCLATVNHPTGYNLVNSEPAITFNQVPGYFSADWSGYINIFVKNIGTLGNSPLGGDGDGDGVGIDIEAFGSGAGCTGTGVVPGAPYNLGRTLTHELGHYLILDHIWGGGCDVDDGIADTPSQQTFNGGCPNANATSCNTIDLHMNYMDYTNDACMYMFSADQSTAMETYTNANLQNVINNAANVCGIQVAFIQSTTSVLENTINCNESATNIIEIPVAISSSTSQNTTVNFAITGGSATAEDYTIGSNSVVFLAGSTATQMLSININPDAIIEADETIIVDIISVTGSEAVTGSPSAFTHTITNDDIAPSASGGGVTEIQAAVNSISGFAEHDLDPNQTVHFYDQETGHIMCTIANGTHDFGCTKVEVISDGNTLMASADPTVIEDLTSKSFLITPATNNSSASYDITLYYTAAEINGFATANSANGSVNTGILFLAKGSGDLSSSAPTETVSATPVAFGDNFTITGSFTTGFSGIGAGDGTTALPIQLISFNAQAEKEYIDLTWSTTSELNNKGFLLERSTDSNSDFKAIGFIPSQGDAIITQTYKFKDRDIINGINYYYRFIQEDFDGKIEYSKIISAKINTTNTFYFNLSPNPAKEYVDLSFSSELSSQSKLEIINIHGQSINYNIAIGRIVKRINTYDLPAGVYIVKLSHGDRVAIKKLVIE